MQKMEKINWRPPSIQRCQPTEKSLTFWHFRWHQQPASLSFWTPMNRIWQTGCWLKKSTQNILSQFCQAKKMFHFNNPSEELIHYLQMTHRKRNGFLWTCPWSTAVPLPCLCGEFMIYKHHWQRRRKKKRGAFGRSFRPRGDDLPCCDLSLPMKALTTGCNLVFFFDLHRPTQHSQNTRIQTFASAFLGRK